MLKPPIIHAKNRRIEYENSVRRQIGEFVYRNRLPNKYSGVKSCAQRYYGYQDDLGEKWADIAARFAIYAFEYAAENDLAWRWRIPIFPVRAGTFTTHLEAALRPRRHGVGTEIQIGAVDRNKIPSHSSPQS